MNPKKMVLGALSACSGMDVVEILQKMKVPFSKLEIEASAEQTDTHPKVFTYIDMVYQVDAPESDRDKVQRAVQLSQEKYCGVSAMLAKNCPINYTILLLPAN
jgi:putative redox protein